MNTTSKVPSFLSRLTASNFCHLFASVHRTILAPQGSSSSSSLLPSFDHLSLKQILSAFYIVVYTEKGEARRRQREEKVRISRIHDLSILSDGSPHLTAAQGWWMDSNKKEKKWNRAQCPRARVPVRLRACMRLRAGARVHALSSRASRFVSRYQPFYSDAFCIWSQSRAYLLELNF